ncbi:hypothetical protein ABKN59_011879 [Abortiporus biennis]
MGATRETSPTIMNALGVAKPTTELTATLKLRRREALTPFKPQAWLSALKRAGLIDRYPSIPRGLVHGFNISFPTLWVSFTPLNSPTLNKYAAKFATIVQHEFDKGRYIGPFSSLQLQALIGPFQSSPLSLVPKPHKPNIFRLVQNFSFPHQPLLEVASINSFLNSDDFLCTWGTFVAFSLLVWGLPPGLQGAVRDVAEAYRNVPLHPSQWPGMVVRLSNTSDLYALDPQACFGVSPNTGLYGHIADAGVDIMRLRGIGPVSKWVDDHTFIRILKKHLESYNEYCHKCRARIIKSGGKHQTGRRIWYGGNTLENQVIEEFDEDMEFDLKALSLEESKYTYNIETIDEISRELGIPWEVSKDQLWSSIIKFTGFLWDLENKTVTIDDSKQQKYILAINEWKNRETHTLKDLQKLYGKLLHASLVLRPGRAYLTNLEKMLGTF